MSTPLLSSVSTILQAGATSIGSTAWPLDLGMMPDSTAVQDRAIVLLHEPGFPDAGRVEIERPGLQILVRGDSILSTSGAYQAAETVSWAAKNALHGYTGQSSSGAAWIVGIWAESAGHIGFDEERRPMFSLNFRIERSRT